MTWSGVDRRRSTPAEREAWLRAHERTAPTSAPESGQWQVMSPGLDVRISPRRIAATVTAVVAVLGGGWWGVAQIKPDGPAIVVPASWKQKVDDYVARGETSGYPRLAALEGQVDDMRKGMGRLEARVMSMTLVLLYRDKWAARGDRDEVDRIQRQIDALEREMRNGGR